MSIQLFGILDKNRSQKTCSPFQRVKIQRKMVRINRDPMRHISEYSHVKRIMMRGIPRAFQQFSEYPIMGHEPTQV